MPPKIEAVEWLDAVSTQGWQDDTDEPEPCHPCLTVGFVVAEQKQFIVVAATWGGDQNNNRITIPKGWVQSRRVLNVKGAGPTSRNRKHSQGGRKRVRDK